MSSSYVNMTFQVCASFNDTCSQGYACSNNSAVPQTLLPDAELGICETCMEGEYCPGSAANWNRTRTANLCSAGYFCLYPPLKYPCPPGMFCHEAFPLGYPCVPGSVCEWPAPDGSQGGAKDQSICPAGYFCPLSTTKVQCPDGYYCKSGFEIPAPCPLLGICSTSSSDPNAPGAKFPNLLGRAIVSTAAVLLVVIIYWKILLGIVRCCQRRANRNFAKNKIVGQFMKAASKDKVFPSLTSKSQRHSISFEKISLSIPRHGLVVENVTGSFPHSSMCAIMGPSGSGKSSLLNAITGKASYGTTTGDLFINGFKIESLSEYKELIGFVPQDDIVYSRLTVRENLEYSALLRLPAKWTVSSKLNVVDDVIRALQLSRVANNVVGDVEKRGISGGQKKRVNIGVEMVAFPDVLFLDGELLFTFIFVEFFYLEPTSGLDATASIEVLSSLKYFSRLGVTVVAVIHQPRYSIFQMFDKVLLLAPGGKTVFLGSPQDAMRYFIAIGYVFPERSNAADFLLDIISGSVPLPEKPDFSVDDLVRIWTTHAERKLWAGDSKQQDFGVNGVSSEPEKRAALFITTLNSERKEADIEPEEDFTDSDSVERVIERMASKTGSQSIDLKELVEDILGEKNSSAVKEVKKLLSLKSDIVSVEEIKANLKNLKNSMEIAAVDGNVVIDKQMTHRRIPSFCRSLSLMLSRDIILVSRDQDSFRFDVFILIFFAAIVGNVYGGDWQFADLNLIVLLCTLSLGLLGANSSLRVFGADRLVFYREAESGVNVPSYYWSKFLVSSFDCIVNPFIFLVVFYNIIVPEASFASIYAIFVFLYFNGAGYAFLFSSMFEPQTALIISVIVPLIMGGLFSGIFPQLKTFSGFMRSLSDLSFTRWSAEAFLIFESAYLLNSPWTVYFPVDLLYFSGGYQFSGSQLLLDFFMLFVLGVLLRILTAVTIRVKTSQSSKLRRLKKWLSYNSPSFTFPKVSWKSKASRKSSQYLSTEHANNASIQMLQSPLLDENPISETSMSREGSILRNSRVLQSSQ
jgi:ABC-type multidrug transport system ATPase subunit